MSNKPIQTSDLDPNFKFEVTDHELARDLNYCFACGTCSAGCPIHEAFPEYDPQRIIRMALLGMKYRVLSSDFLWLCSTCYTCYERCPQDVKLVDIMTVLKNMAVKEGHIHHLYKEQMNSIASYGTVYKIDNKRRERHGLPPVRTNAREVSEIFKVTGVMKSME